MVKWEIAYISDKGSCASGGVPQGSGLGPMVFIVSIVRGPFHGTGISRKEIRAISSVVFEYVSKVHGESEKLKQQRVRSLEHLL